LQQRLDAANIDNLVRGYQQINPFPETQDTPAGVIKQVSRCRIVVTGAYHAAVFALAQGIPAVALARSPYFLDKFRGLRDIFDGGCEVVLLEPDNLDERLYKAMTAAWESADRLRAPLRNAASTQIEASQAAYRRFAEIVLPREPAASTRASL
jgi:colanic acid/amylovoran biosynthesis protein